MGTLHLNRMQTLASRRPLKYLRDWRIRYNWTRVPPPLDGTISIKSCIIHQLQRQLAVERLDAFVRWTLAERRRMTLHRRQVRRCHRHTPTYRYVHTDLARPRGGLGTFEPPPPPTAQYCHSRNLNKTDDKKWWYPLIATSLCLHGLLPAPFLLSYSVFSLIFRFWTVR